MTTKAKTKTTKAKTKTTKAKTKMEKIAEKYAKSAFKDCDSVASFTGKYIELIEEMNELQEKFYKSHGLNDTSIEFCIDMDNTIRTLSALTINHIERCAGDVPGATTFTYLVISSSFNTAAEMLKRRADTALEEYRKLEELKNEDQTN